MKKLLCLFLALLLLPAVFAASVSRSMPASADANQQLTITLTADAPGDFFVIVRENIPTGWAYVSGGAQDGSQVKLFLTSLVGNSATTSAFTGTYQYTDDATPQAITGANQVTVSGNGNGDNGENGFDWTWVLIIGAVIFVILMVKKK